MCDVRVTSRHNVVSDGVLIQQDPTVIGTPIVRNIQLNIIGKCFILSEIHIKSIMWVYRKLCFEVMLIVVDKMHAVCARTTALCETKHMEVI